MSSRVAGPLSFLVVLALLAGCQSAPATGPTASPPGTLASVRPTPPPPSGSYPAPATALPEIARIKLTDPPLELRVRDGALWVGAMRHLYRIDTATNTVAQEIEIGEYAQGYTFEIAFGSAWVSEFTVGDILRYDLATGKQVAAIPIAGAPQMMVAAADRLWVAAHHNGELAAVDPISNATRDIATVGQGGEGGPQGVVATNSTVWTAVPNMNEVVAVDTSTAKATQHVKVTGFASCPISIVGTQVWAPACADEGNHSIAVIDTVAAKLLGSVTPGNLPLAVVDIDGLPWIPIATTFPTEDGLGVLVAVDPKTLEMVRSVIMPAQGNVASAFDSLWIADTYDHALLRVAMPGS